MTRTLLVVGGGIEAVPGLERAREMGLHLVVSDVDADAPGMAAADDTLLASTYDAAATIAAAAAYHEEVGPIDGVMCIATDVPLTVARVAAELGLPGIPVAVAERAADKLLMKDKFREDGIPIPWYSPVESAEHLEQLVAEQGFPLVVKPVDSRGSRGVLRLTPGVDVAAAFAEAQRHSPTDRVMVEEFLDGPQVSTESLVLDGVAHTPGFADRNYEFLDRYAPHIIENGGELPSELPDGIQVAVRDLVAAGAASLGVHEGVIKGDVVVAGGVPHVIELAARLSGGYFCTHEIPLSTGVDLVGNAIRLALGDPVDPADLVPRTQRCLSQRYLFPEPGRVVSVEGQDDVAEWPGGVELCEVRVKPGDIVAPVDSHRHQLLALEEGGGRNRDHDGAAVISPFFIAEVSSNHGRDLERSLATIDAAAAAGCDAVKFQLFRIDELFAPEILEASEEHRRRREWELPVEFIPDLAARCRQKGVQFGCTPFYLDAVAELLPHVDFYKVASYELLWDELVAACATTGKPLILSTGMATMDEIEHAVEVARTAGAEEPTVLHCTSAYPTPPDEANLGAIATIRDAFGTRVGWSDHTADPAVILRAIHRWGAEVVEIHIDLDGTGAEFEPGHCWLPHQIESLVSGVRRGMGADGTGVKEPAAAEERDRLWRADPGDGLRPFQEIRDGFEPGS